MAMCKWVISFTFRKRLHQDAQRLVGSAHSALADLRSLIWCHRGRVVHSYRNYPASLHDCVSRWHLPSATLTAWNKISAPVHRLR